MNCAQLLIAAFTVFGSLNLTTNAISAPLGPNSPNAPVVTDLAPQLSDEEFTALLDDSTPEEIAATLNFSDEDDATIQNAASDNSLIQIHVSIARQEMTVRTPNGDLGPWPVSTARKGMKNAMGVSYVNPNRMHVRYFSKSYENSPMPNSLFFRGGFAIHATGYVKNLGRPASHGCVRLSPANALKLFSVVQPIVKQYGAGAARVEIR